MMEPMRMIQMTRVVSRDDTCCSSSMANKMPARGALKPGWLEIICVHCKRKITAQTYKYIRIWICIYIYMYKHVPISELCKYACRDRCISIRLFLHLYMHTWINKPLYRPIDLKWCYTVWDQCIFCALEKKRPGWYHLLSWLFAYWNRHGSLGWLNTIHDDHHEMKIFKIITIMPQ